jgi:hypothetical protein
MPGTGGGSFSVSFCSAFLLFALTFLNSNRRCTQAACKRRIATYTVPGTTVRRYAFSLAVNGMASPGVVQGTLGFFASGRSVVYILLPSFSPSNKKL